MHKHLSDDCVKKLLDGLAEQPIEQNELWIARWGGVQQGDNKPVPANIFSIALDILGAKTSRTILVHGRYGTGKSSFMRSLEKQIKTNDQAISLWLDMPSLTSHIDSTALAAVMIRIAETLEEEWGDSSPDLCHFGKALEDLWRIEARTLSSQCDAPCDPAIPPEPNRMAGTVRGEGRAFVKANRLEQPIQNCLDSPGLDKKMKLVVFLDDLDRCERRVAMDVIRLLLRFGPTHSVHFVLACDWDVLEQGVKDWMHRHGKADDGAPLVTANSALEKYIHVPVELPGMGAKANVWQGNKGMLTEAMRKVLEAGNAIIEKDAQQQETYKQPQLSDVLINLLMSKECQ